MRINIAALVITSCSPLSTKSSIISSAKRIDERHRQDEIDEHDTHGCEDATAHTGRIAGPDILSAVCGHGQTDILKDAGEEIFYAHRCRESSHTRGAEGVVGTLEHDDADAGDGELQAHRHTVVEQNGDALVVESPLAALGDKDFHSSYDIPPAQDAREKLREQCGESGTEDSQSADEDEQHVEDDIDHRRENEEKERMLRVAEGPQESRQEVIAYGEAVWRGTA